VTGEINRITNWIYKEVCSKWSDLNSLSKDGVSVSINVSPAQIKYSDFVKDIKEIIKHSEMSPEKIIIEITESSFMENFNVAVKKLNELKELGIRIALDDFGSGYSSFNYLGELPLDIMKIDKQLIDNIIDNKEKAILLGTITELSHKLGLKVVGEGVETKEQYEYLKKNNCDYIQGYYFYKPKRLEELIKSKR